MKSLKSIFAALCAMALFVGCADDPYEDAGENMEEMGEDIGDSIEEGAENTKDAVEDAVD